MSESSIELRGAEILIVDDVPANLDVLRRALEEAGYRILVALTGELALQLAAEAEPDLILLDVLMPGMDGFAVCRQLKARPATQEIPVIFLTARDDTQSLEEGFRVGGVDYVVKPFQKEEVLVRIRTHLEKARLVRALVAKNRALEEEIAQRQRLASERNQLAGRLFLNVRDEGERWEGAGLVGQSPAMAQLLGRLVLLHQAPSTSVLITGESGTGKELIARALHFSGPRAGAPFVPVNCAAIPRELAESLFFGHQKGAFSGADRNQAGYFELAQGGTLFLDEVGDLPLELQPKLLRVLEDGRIRPMGSQEEKLVEVRVVAATNVDLAAQIQAGTFRQDLYFRLARFTIEVPPLRQHCEDIPLLARHFLSRCAREMNMDPPELSAEALALLEGYDFPGNVRELKNAVERALIESQGRAIGPEHLHLGMGTGSAAPTAALSLDALPLSLEQALEQTEEALVRRALAQTRDNVAATARLLGTNRNRIYRWVKKG